MRVDELPDLNPPDFGNVVDAVRPILSFAWSSPRAQRPAAHRHPRGHIIHTVAGALWAVTPEGTWLVPAGQAIWIPPAIHHEVCSQAAVSARMLFVDAAFAAPLPPRCGTVKVSALLAEVMLRCVGYGTDYLPNGPAANLARVLLDELAAMEVVPLLLPLSKDARLARVMDRLIADPGTADGIEQAARGCGASPRTLARLFRSETGMTFSQWKTRLHLLESIERLARGASVTQVALDLGQATTSSGVYMFGRHMGAAPGDQ